jgi:hypothetical protein
MKIVQHSQNPDSFTYCFDTKDECKEFIDTYLCEWPKGALFSVPEYGEHSIIAPSPKHIGLQDVEVIYVGESSSILIMQSQFAYGFVLPKEILQK